jgi:hypothetical protein
VGHTWGVLGAAILAVLVFLEVPAPWIPGSLMLLGVLWMLWSRWRASILHCVEALGFCLLGLIAIATSAWPLAGSWHGLPLRSVSALAALLLAYVLQHLLHRSQHEEHPDKVLLSDHFDPVGLGVLATALLLILSLALGLLVKVEFLAHDKNLLVALVWGLLGVLYLERGRGLRDWKWILCGHVGLMAALVHFLAVNLLQPGSIGPLSLRLITGLPFLGLLSYAYLNWKELDFVAEAPQGAAAWRHVYLYAIQLAIAMLLLYEGTRAWVLPLWALQALLALIWGLRQDNAHWLRSSLLLVIACAFRGIGTNLYFRDQAGGLALNLVTVPAAALLILVGYILLRRRLEGEARLDLTGLGAGINRMPWLLVQAILLFGFIWVEVSGTVFTVWLSLLGLGMVVLGFIYQERVARFLGLGLLSACIFKLVYDLRELKGIPRVLSFIVPGMVLIVVSFVYTRYKERLEKLL